MPITVVLSLAVALAGCTSTEAGTATTASTPSVSALVSGNSGGVAECRDADVHVASTNGGGAGGHMALLLTFANESGHTCYLQGFPAVSLVDTSGKVLLRAKDTLDGFIGGSVANGGTGLTAPPRVVLAPARSAMAVLEWEDVDPIQGVPGGCLVLLGAAVQVTPPGSKHVSRLLGLRDVCDAFRINPVIDKTPS